MKRGAKGAPDRLGRILKWVGAATAVISLMLGARQLITIATDNAQRNPRIVCDPAVAEFGRLLRGSKHVGTGSFQAAHDTAQQSGWRGAKGGAGHGCPAGEHHRLQVERRRDGFKSQLDELIPPRREP
jgi:hypothetical protein